MEKDVKKTKLPYVSTVELTYKTYKNALYDCISKVSEIIRNSSSFLAEDIPEYVQLLAMLTGQLEQVKAFLNDYSQIEETL